MSFSIFPFRSSIVFALYILRLFLKKSSRMVTKCRRSDRFRKSSVDAKTSGRKFYEKGRYRLKMSSHKLPLNCKREK